ncbi:MAG: sulfatase [Nanoarchaeota archaeon]|nr:sulfatase [Nanoarchaeota archaeon]
MKNVIVILVDAFRPDHLSMFGYQKETDKHLKVLAKDNILFRNHFSTSNATAPSLASLFTGKYPNHHGVLHQLPYNQDEEFTNFEKAQAEFWLPSFLRDKGYETIGVDWLGMWFQKGFTHYDEIMPGETPKNPNAPFTSTKEMTDLAIHRIKNSTKPFFLFMHLWDTHFPYPHIEYTGESKDVQATLDSIKDEKQREYMRRRIENKGLYTFSQMIEKYDLAIETVNNHIKRLQEFLMESGKWDDTIFLFLGDHATSIGEHGIYFSHSGLFDISLRVPFIMKIPGINSKDISQYTQHTDILPTILDYLGLDTGLKFDGKSMRPLFENGTPIREEMFFFDGLCKDIRAVRTKNKKLIFANDNFCHLCKGGHHAQIEEYDLEKDPDETTNVYQGESELQPLMDTIK